MKRILDQIWMAIFENYLHQLPCMSLMEEVVNSIGVDSNPPFYKPLVYHVSGDFLRVINGLALHFRNRIVIKRRGR